MVRLERFELPTFWFVARRSIQLSYRRARRISLLFYRFRPGAHKPRHCGPRISVPDRVWELLPGQACPLYRMALMRVVLTASTFLLTSTVIAGEVDPKVIRLIGPDARLIYGIDVERYKTSILATVYPISQVDLSAPFKDIRQLIVAKKRWREYRSPITIVRGALSRSKLQSWAGLEGRAVSFHRGVPVLTTSRYKCDAVLDEATVIMGTVDDVREAIDRWRQEESRPDESATTVRRLSSSFDNWFLAVKPLADSAGRQQDLPQKFRDELVQAIEEARGGIHFGGFNDVSVEVVMKTADDAMALAAIGRWLPGLIELGWHGPETVLAEAVENLWVRAEGRVVTLSFSLPESRLQEVVEAERKAYPALH